MSGSIEELLDGASICVCVGSGGVGKTTTSAAIAAGVAARGRRVHVLTIDPAKRLADSLGLEELGNEERQVDPALFSEAGIDVGLGELWASMLDAKATFDGVIATYADGEASKERILSNRIYRQISGALAGSQEYMAMERLYEIHERGGYDLLILDTPPSRNALDFLDAPRRLLGFIEGRAIRLFLRPSGFGMRVAGRGFSVVTTLVRRLTGLDLVEDLSEFFAAMSGTIAGFRERAARVEELLAAETTRFLIVCGPAGEPIDEALHLREKLNEGDLPLAGVVVNRIHPGIDGGDEDSLAAELEDVVGEPDLVRRVLASRADARARSERDRLGIERLKRRFGGASLIEVPEQPDEVHDLAGLLALAPYLFSGDPQVPGRG